MIANPVHLFCGIYLSPVTETAATFRIANEGGEGEEEDEEYNCGDISSLDWKIVDFSKALL